MSFALIRRALILALLAASMTTGLLRLGNDIAAAASNAARRGDVRANADSLQVRMAGLDTRLATQQQLSSGHALPVAEGTAAGDALQTLMRVSLDRGTVLSVRFDSAQPGLVGAQLLWRGTEGEMRVILENLAANLPFARVVRLNLRAVVLDGADLVEMDMGVIQAWEAV